MAISDQCNKEIIKTIFNLSRTSVDLTLLHICLEVYGVEVVNMFTFCYSVFVSQEIERAGIYHVALTVSIKAGYRPGTVERSS